MVICDDKMCNKAWVKVYLQLEVFSFDVVDTYPGDSCMSSLSITKQINQLFMLVAMHQ